MSTSVDVFLFRFTWSTGRRILRLPRPLDVPGWRRPSSRGDINRSVRPSTGDLPVCTRNRGCEERGRQRLYQHVSRGDGTRSRSPRLCLIDTALRHMLRSMADPVQPVSTVSAGCRDLGPRTPICRSRSAISEHSRIHMHSSRWRAVRAPEVSKDRHRGAGITICTLAELIDEASTWLAAYGLLVEWHAMTRPEVSSDISNRGASSHELGMARLVSVEVSVEEKKLGD